MTENRSSEERLRVVLNDLCLTKKSDVYLMIVHADPSIPQAGGTERHVESLLDALQEAGHAVFVLFPSEQATIGIRYAFQHQILFEDVLSDQIIFSLISEFEKSVDCLHIHHILGWREPIIIRFSEGRFLKKIITLHDFYFICPSIQMLKGPTGITFCGVEKDIKACNHCLRYFHGFRNYSIERYRQHSFIFLRRFDKIVLPSESIKIYFKEAFQKYWNELEHKVAVVSHDLSALFKYADEQELQIKQANQSLYVFVGALSFHKGFHLIAGLARRLRAEGKKMEIWGRALAWHPFMRGVVVRPYHSTEELKNLFVQYQPAYVILPFLWAETFSYVFYETMILGKQAVSVVGKYGYPAEVIAQTHAGIVMDTMDADGLYQACLAASQNYDACILHKQEWICALKNNQHQYTERYLKILYDLLDKNFYSLSISHEEHVLLCGYSQKKKNMSSLSLLIDAWHLIFTRLRNPHAFIFFIGRGMQVFREEGLNGIKDRLHRFFFARSPYDS